MLSLVRITFHRCGPHKCKCSIINVSMALFILAQMRATHMRMFYCQCEHGTIYARLNSSFLRISGKQRQVLPFQHSSQDCLHLPDSMNNSVPLSKITESYWFNIFKLLGTFQLHCLKHTLSMVSMFYYKKF